MKLETPIGVVSRSSGVIDDATGTIFEFPRFSSFYTDQGCLLTSAICCKTYLVITWMQSKLFEVTNTIFTFLVSLVSIDKVKYFQQNLKRSFYEVQDPYQEKVIHGQYNLYHLL